MRSRFKFLGVAPIAALAAALVVSSTAGAAPLPAQAAPAASSGSFTQTFSDSFDSLNTKNWSVYQGIPSCCPQSRWAKSHVTATGGALDIATYKDGGKWTTGGVSMAKYGSQTYGKWAVRFRMDKGAGVGMDVALRPKGSGTVVDWIEESSDHGAQRNYESATLHYGNTRVHANVTADFTVWHTMTLTWTPGKITVDLDGKVWATYTSHVPTAPMHLIMQSNIGTNGFSGVMPGASTPSKVNLQIDSVTVSKYNK